MNTLSKTVATVIAVAGFASASVAFAQKDPDEKRPAEPNEMQDMMQGNGGMGMMPMMNMMTQMNEMMGTCNQMMKTMLPSQEKPATEQDQPDKG
jgi:protein CpxP